jgi:hypothetical protein
MRRINLKINYNGEAKNLTLVGEIHYYNRQESEWAKNLLNRESFDIIFLEGSETKEYWGKVGYIAKWLMKLFYKAVTVIIRRNSPTLIDFAKKKKISIKYLEKGTTLPLTTQFGLVCLFGILVIFIIRTALQNPSDLLLYIPILLIALILIPIIMWDNPSIGRKFKKFVPANVAKRDAIMCKNLISYIKNVKFQNAIVLVGLLHFDSIMECLKKENEFKILERN